jgi:hypothetical protein
MNSVKLKLLDCRIKICIFVPFVLLGEMLDFVPMGKMINDLKWNEFRDFRSRHSDFWSFRL